MQSAVLAIVNPSVRLSVYLSVTRWHSFRMPVTFCIFCIQSPHVCGAVHYSLFARGSTFVFVFSSPHLHICLRHLVYGENFTDTVHQAHYKWNSQEHHGLLASLWKGQVVPIDVSRAPGSISSGGGPPPCHRRRDATTTWLAETSGRPRSTWLKVIDEDVQPQNFGVHTAWRKAKERDAWHQIVSTATLC